MSENSRHATMDAGEKPKKYEGLKCYLCSLEEVQNDVNCFCIQCVEHLCSNCAKDHRKIKLTRCHVLLEGEETPTDASAFEEMAKLTFCKIHTGREIEFKCDSHNVFICSVCLRETHRACDNVVSVNEFVIDRESFKSEYFEKHFAMESSLDEEKKMHTNLLDNKDTTEILNQMKSLSTELQNIIMQVDTDKLKTENEKLCENKSKLDGFYGVIHSNLKLVDVVMKYGSDTQLAILSYSANSTIASIQNGIESLEKFAFESTRSMTRHITNDLEYLKHAISRLKTNLSVSKLLDLGVSELDDLTLSSENIRTAKSHSEDENKEEMASFNPIRPTDDLLEGTVVKDLKQEDVETSSESVLLSLFDSTIRKDKSYDISVSGRKSSAKTSSSMAAVIFNGGYMMFADSNNKVVKLLSDEFEVLTYISLKNKPTDLSLVEDKLVMVAGGYSVLF